MADKAEEAKRLLSDVDPQKAFWLYGGKVLRNLNELSESLKSMTEEVFKYHVNKEKNDFANWINDVIGDIDLTKDLRKLKTREVISKVVDKRISDLKKAAK
jgi:hypothetical protein